MRFRHSVRYITRFSILFIIGCVAYVISTIVIYNILSSAIIQRSILLSTLIERKIKISTLGLYSIESQLSNSSFSINNLYPDYHALINDNKTASELIDSLKSSSSFMTEEKTLNLLSKSLQNYYFYSYPSNNMFLRLGTTNGLHYLIQESQCIIFSGGAMDKERLNKYLLDVIEYNNVTEYTTAQADRDSSDYIINQLNNLIYFTCAVCLLLVLMYCCYFYQILNTEIKFVGVITKILKILPNPLQRNSLQNQYQRRPRIEVL